MKRIHSKNSIFLMEIILNILLFCVLVIIGLQFFMRAHRLTEDTSSLHNAVTICNNTAAIFESGDGTLDELLATYEYRVNLDDRVIIYLNEDFENCEKEQSRYFITAALSEDSTDRMSKLNITCYDETQNPIYSLTACNYRQRSLSAYPAKEVIG